MYKVFIKNRVIIFLTNENINALHSNSDLIIVSDKKSLNKQLASAENKKQNIYFVHDEPKKMRKKFFEAYKIITAAGGIVQNGDLFLFIKRLDVWDIPKGKIEKGEKKQIAAVREIEEECGIKLPVIQNKLITTYHTYNYKGEKAIKKTYWYHLLHEGSLETEPQLEEDITEARWFKQSDFDMLKAGSYASIREVIGALEKELIKK